MAQKGTSVERSVKSATPDVVHVELAEIGKKGVDAIIHMQRELCDAFGEMNRDWFARAQAEANLASELAQADDRPLRSRHGHHVSGVDGSADGDVCRK